MMKKGQFSLEFIMTYGWVIFVVLGVVAAFSFMGVLHPETIIGKRCLLSQPLFCEESSFDITTGDIVLRIRNNLDNDVNINEIELDEEGCYILIMKGTGEETIKADSSKDFVIDCDIEEGQRIKGDIQIRYAKYKAPIGLEKVARGSITGSV